jgi:TonB-linked SusC/RagA family outer membrane protein
MEHKKKNGYHLKALYVLLLMFIPFYSFSQITIRGTVTDGANDEPLPGVNVVVKGTTTGTVTDLDGNYTIEVPDESSKLIFSFVGYLADEIVVGDRRKIDINLTPDLAKLDEVVVVGYGTQRSRDVTGAISKINIEEQEELPLLDASQALRGKVAGVNTVQSTRPGESASIIIRGNTSLVENTVQGRGSFSDKNDALIILDGVRYTGNLSDINVNDIESIDILKDASSASVYGARGANGVVLITTKTGKNTDKPTIGFNAYYGKQDYSKKIDYLDPAEYIQKNKDFWQMQGIILEDSADIASTMGSLESSNYLNNEYYDIYDVFSAENPSIQNYNLNVSGGTDNTSYYMGASHYNEQGLIYNDQYSRNTVRVNLENQTTEWLKLGTRTSYAYTDKSGVAASMSLKNSPFGEYYDENGDIVQRVTQYHTHPLDGTRADSYRPEQNLFLLGYGVLEPTFVDGLNYQLNFSYNRRWQENKNYFGSNTLRGESIDGSASWHNYTGSQWQFENIINYEKLFARVHEIKATLLYSSEATEFFRSSFASRGFASDALSYYAIQDGRIILFDETASESRTGISSMIRLNYKFKNRYLLTATVRRDGFSEFGEDTRYGIFPGVALGWVISSESFASDIKRLDFLKLRVSYGENGNNAIPNYATLTRLYTDNFLYGGQSTPITTFFTGNTASDFFNTAGRAPNASLSWESTLATNVGLDYGFFDNRVNGSFEYYYMHSYDQLQERSLVHMTGNKEIWTNLGEIENKGVEFTLNTRNISSSNFTWESTVTFSRNKNKILHLTGEDVDGDGKEDDNIENNWFIGHPIYANYDFELDGIVQEGETYLPDNPVEFLPGYYRIVDQTGDGKITAEDKKVLHADLPDYRVGVNNILTYRNFSLSFFVNIVQGGYRNNPMLDIGTTSSNLFPGQNNIIDVNYWTPENNSEDYPSLVYPNAYNHGVYDSRSFIRLQDASLSWQLPERWLNTINIQSARLYISGRNLLIWTDWHDWDPEGAELKTYSQTENPDNGGFMPGTNQLQRYRGYPLPRVYTIGININL